MIHLDPSTLRAICHAPTKFDTPRRPPHLTNNSLQKRSLPRTNGTYNRYELAAGNRKVDILEFEHILLVDFRLFCTVLRLLLGGIQFLLEVLLFRFPLLDSFG
jgi:hypothetical protein